MTRASPIAAAAVLSSRRRLISDQVVRIDRGLGDQSFLLLDRAVSFNRGLGGSRALPGGPHSSRPECAAAAAPLSPPLRPEGERLRCRTSASTDVAAPPPAKVGRGFSPAPRWPGSRLRLPQLPCCPGGARPRNSLPSSMMTPAEDAVSGRAALAGHSPYSSRRRTPRIGGRRARLGRAGPSRLLQLPFHFPQQIPLAPWLGKHGGPAPRPRQPLARAPGPGELLQDMLSVT